MPVDYEEKLADLRELIERNENAIEEIDAKLDLLSANLKHIVPNGDFVGHGLYHAGLIEAQHRKKQIYDAIIQKTLEGLVWALIAGTAVAVWQTFLTIVRKG